MVPELELALLVDPLELPEVPDEVEPLAEDFVVLVVWTAVVLCVDELDATPGAVADEPEVVLAVEGVDVDVVDAALLEA